MLRDFRRASSSAPASRTDGDLAAAVAAVAVVVGIDRAVAATCRVLDSETIQAVLTRLQRSTLDPETVRMAQSQKGFLKTLREDLATAAGVEVPKLVETKRISWPNLLMVVGSLVGLWLIIGVLTEASGSLSVIRGASWGWVAAAFVLAQLPVVTGAWALTGAVMGPLPFGRCVALETSNLFTSFVGGDAAVFGVRVRFFQRQGLDAPAAISSGAIAGTASWVVKGVLFMVCLPFAVGDFHKPTSSDGGSHQGIVWIILIVVLVIAILVAVVTLVPRVRRLAAEKARPHLVTIWNDMKAIAVEPRKIAYVLGGSLGSQVLIALCLGASLHSVGEHASFATLIVVLTLAAMIGGAVPVPGGAGVIEVGTDRRPHRGGHPAGPGRGGRVHRALLHRVPAADLGLGHAGLVASQRLRLTYAFVPALGSDEERSARPAVSGGAGGGRPGPATGRGDAGQRRHGEEGVGTRQRCRQAHGGGVAQRDGQRVVGLAAGSHRERRRQRVGAAARRRREAPRHVARCRGQATRLRGGQRVGREPRGVGRARRELHGRDGDGVRVGVARW